MATQKLSQRELQDALDASVAHKTQGEAAKALGLNRLTLVSRLSAAKEAGLEPSPKGYKKLPLTDQIRKLEQELKRAQAESADAAAVKQLIGATADRAAQLVPPKWLEPKEKAPSSPGVPTLFLSDLHWGEVVHPSQIGGVNQYNLSIAHQRLTDCVNTAVKLLKILSPGMKYPGIVIPLGGDMISGDIHEELSESNELPTIPTVLDLHSALVSAITHAANTFGAVFVPCVTGNHGRNTKKIRAKDRHHTSFDWLLYQLLAKHFANDKRVTFYIPDSSDAFYRIYGTRYLLTHGDQFRGGDGMIGALGPIIRGDHRKRSRNGQIGMEYDTMICGHWHSYMHLTRLIVNGSLKGYDEYAYTSNFGFEVAQQALWVTHPRKGITFRAPIYLDERNEKMSTSWVSVPSVK